MRGPPRGNGQQESRFLPAATVAALVLILVFVPRHYRLLPEFSEIVIGALLIAFIYSPFRRYAITVFSVVVLGVEITILSRLLYEMAAHPEGLDAFVLLWTAIDLWLTNVVVFTLIYWQLDRGGPAGRSKGWTGTADFHFPRGDAADGLPSDWLPSFTDYFYLAFTTSTAFSPSETYPLTDRAKVLHILQSIISLLTIVALAARAINVLGK